MLQSHTPDQPMALRGRGKEHKPFMGTHIIITSLKFAFDLPVIAPSEWQHF